MKELVYSLVMLIFLVGGSAIAHEHSTNLKLFSKGVLIKMEPVTVTFHGCKNWCYGKDTIVFEDNVYEVRFHKKPSGTLTLLGDKLLIRL